MKEVLPSIKDEDSNKVLQGGNEDMVDGLCKSHLPSSECRGSIGRASRRYGIVATSQDTGKQGIRRRHALGDGGRVETDKAEQTGQGALGKADASGPDSNVVVLLANHLLRLSDCKRISGRDLDDLLDDDIAGNLVASRVVSLGDFFRGMEAVLREEIQHVDTVEEERHDPVDDDGQHQRQPEVGDEGEQVGLWLEGVGRQRRKRGIVETVVRHDGGLGGEVVHDAIEGVDHAKNRQLS